MKSARGIDARLARLEAQAKVAREAPWPQIDEVWVELCDDDGNQWVEKHRLGEPWQEGGYERQEQTS